MQQQYGVPQGEPGKAAKTAKTGLGIGGAVGAIGASAVIGATASGPAAPIGAVVGAILGVIGVTLSAISGSIDPERAAARTELMQSGLSRAYSDEYAQSRLLDNASLLARAGTLADLVARTGKQSDLDKLAAIRTLRAERGASVAVQTAALVANTPRTGTIPLWAPVAFLAIVSIGALWSWKQR